jgi:hypothetical protein
VKEQAPAVKEQAPAVPGGGSLESQEAQKNAEDVDHLPDTDIDLEKLLLSRYNTRIGRFGAFHTPKYMKEVGMIPSYEEVSIFFSRLIVISAVILFGELHQSTPPKGSEDGSPR